MTTITATGTGFVGTPAGATSVDVEAWAGGGSSDGTHGGGGGGYAGSFGLAVVGGTTTIFYSVGAGGAGGGHVGNASWIRVGTNSTPTLSSQGAAANPGSAGTSASALGGSTTGAVGSVLWAGGNGDSASLGNGGGGAGSGGAGGNGSSVTSAGGTGGIDDGRGGGAGGDGGPNQGGAPSAPSGGAGKSVSAVGGNGQVRYTFHIPNTGTLAATETADAVNIHATAVDLGTLAASEVADAGGLIAAAISSGTLAVSETADTTLFITAAPDLAALATTETGDAGGFVAAQSGFGTVVATEVADAGGFLLSTIASGALEVSETGDAGGFVATEIASGTLAATETADAAAFTVAPPALVLAATEAADAGSFFALAGASGILGATEAADTGAVAALAGAFGALVGTEAGDAAAFSFISLPIAHAALAASEAPDFATIRADITGVTLGDVENFRRRLRRLMPGSWFPNPSTILWGTLSGFAHVASSTYSLLKYAKQQTRMATTTDAFLDIAAQDYTGPRIQRRPGEGDTNFRDRIVGEALRVRNTRTAIEVALMQLTGRPAQIFEPWNTADTGALNKSIFLTGKGPFAGIGCVGSRDMPYTIFVNAYRPLSPEQLTSLDPRLVALYLSGSWPFPGVATVETVGRWAIPYAIFLPTDTNLTVSDADIYSMVSSVKAAGIKAWVRIQN